MKEEAPGGGGAVRSRNLDVCRQPEKLRRLKLQKKVHTPVRRGGQEPQSRKGRGKKRSETTEAKGEEMTASESQTERRHYPARFRENLRQATGRNPEAGSAEGDGNRVPSNRQDAIGRCLAGAGALQGSVYAAELHRERVEILDLNCCTSKKEVAAAVAHDLGEALQEKAPKLFLLVANAQEERRAVVELEEGVELKLVASCTRRTYISPRTVPPPPAT